MTANGIVLQGELFDAGGNPQLVRLFVDIDEDGGYVHVRRVYSERGQVLTLSIADIEATLAMLKSEALRALEPGVMAGQLALDDGGSR